MVDVLFIRGPTRRLRRLTYVKATGCPFPFLQRIAFHPWPRRKQGDSDIGLLASNSLSAGFLLGRALERSDVLLNSPLVEAHRRHRRTERLQALNQFRWKLRILAGRCAFPAEASAAGGHQGLSEYPARCLVPERLRQWGRQTRAMPPPVWGHALQKIYPLYNGTSEVVNRTGLEIG